MFFIFFMGCFCILIIVFEDVCLSYFLKYFNYFYFDILNYFDVIILKIKFKK